MTLGPSGYSSRHLSYRSSTADLTPRIKKLFDDGMTISQLAKRFGISYSVIWKAINGKKYPQKAKTNIPENRENSGANSQRRRQA